MNNLINFPKKINFIDKAPLIKNDLNLKNNFLNIFLAQIKNQNPINPLKNNELTSQLAQINMNNGINKINKHLLNITKNINNQKLIRSPALIGHGILFPNSTIAYNGKKDTFFGVYLPHDATLVKIMITDKNKKILFSKKINNLKSGVHSFTWNGTNNNGKKVDNGSYHCSITAQNKDKDISCQTLNYAVIHGIINLTNKLQMIDLGKLGIIEFKSIRKIF